MNDELVLHALDASNPLAFLAALGTLRLLSLEAGPGVRMAWRRRDGFWRPALRPISMSKEELCENLAASPGWAPVEEFVRYLGNNITVPVSRFQPFVAHATAMAQPDDRRTADFAAAFGSDVCEEEDNNRIERTDFCFITGSGHQDFLGTAAELAVRVTTGHVYDALFGEWKAEKKCSMRWDPTDAAEYALQWDDPGPKGAWAVWGANRLAFEALPYFPTAPVGVAAQTVRLRTTGFSRRKRQHEFTWPIWRNFIGPASVRSLLSLEELQKEAPERTGLYSMGIQEIYRAQRVRIGQGANFKVSFRPARAL
jgi:hypothetical protein